MPENLTTLLAEAFTWYAPGLRDLVRERLDEADLDTSTDTVEDLCGDLWLHAAEITATHPLTFAELLDLLDRNANLLVNRLHYQPEVIVVGRLDTAADLVDVAELALATADSTGHQPPLPRPRHHAAKHRSPQRTAA
ncbi:hypothetical protein ACIRRH_35700 [Kitasatospora sp. NPDC101235]|uniref:hypothetical protein n=1 Tax=Kitasatospora sp. NPDC101235 TaxID=3364101 RepID=UPI0037F40B05